MTARLPGGGKPTGHFEEVLAAKTFTPTDVSAGREYVKAYVEFIHYVERLYDATITSVHRHSGETAPGADRR
jgi:hypothetical protein